MVAGLVLALSSAGVSAAQAAPAAPAGGRAGDRFVTHTRVLNSEALLRIGRAAIREAHRRGQRVTVAIVDRSGATRLVLKTAHAGPQTEESAKRKAFTAVSFGQPTSKLAANAVGDGPTIRDIPGTLFLAGGVPVISGGMPIAGIGVGGAPQGSIDEAIARAGLRAVEGALGR
ncbi:heme-binding protein [Bailinhaonella thermotolerans]|uniref:Heme-binding protein n=2 Tax=Bailinhaonella thermotolerans TaxID=1070861 RepID=A0A3A4BBA9_9ACTN|nr:heme-binding protein [Bailinhaonella thermotolerans]